MAASALAGHASRNVVRPPRPALLSTIAVGGCAAATGAYVLTLSGDDQTAPHVLAGLVAWITLAYVACGLVAWSRRPDSRFGPLLVAAGFAPFLSRLRESDAAVLYMIGEACRLLPVAVFLHVFLAYPSGRLHGRFERMLVVAAYSLLALPVIGLALGSPDRDDLPALVQSADAAEIVRGAQRLGVAAVAFTAFVLLVPRVRGAARLLRISPRLLVGCFVLALGAMGAGIVAQTFGVPAGDQIRWVAFGLVGVAPILFLLGLLGARLARSAVGDLVVELRGSPAPAALQGALARALGDPSLTLAYWLPQFGTWADVEGRPVELPADNPHRATTLIDREGGHMAVLIHNPSLEDEAELLRSVCAAAAIALDNSRLHVELRARLDELAGSRARVLEAGQKERQRLERDLHDGAQQRLVALSLELSLLEERLGADPDARLAIDHARREIAASLQELRDLAHGIHPAVVTGHGLAVALEQLAAHAAVPVRLAVDVDERLPEPLEVAAYYLVSESLMNIDKHAHASSASVEVGRRDGFVVVEIVDDGVGGADTERGTGLRGLADRVEALGGHLRIWTPRGGGTRVRAEMPCAS